MNNNNPFRFILFIVLILTSFNCFTQKIENVHPEIAGEKIHIYYDLIDIAPDQSVIVKLFMSTDGGKTYGEYLKSVTGDVGVVIGPGENRCIIWDVFDEVDELVSLNVKFKVTADLMQTGQSSKSLERIFKLDLNSNLGLKLYPKSKSFGFNLKGAVYLEQLGLGVRGDYYKTFPEETIYIEIPDSGTKIYPDTGYYWGYTGGAIIEYDLLRNTRYSLYPFLYIGMAKILYDTEYDIKNYTYSIFGSLGLGFDINIIRFLYLGVELEYYLSPWLEFMTPEEEDEGIDGLSIGFVIKFVINPG